MIKTRTIIVLFVLANLAIFSGRAISATPEEIRMSELQTKLEELQHEQDRIREDLSVTQEQRQSLQREISLLQGQVKLVESQISATDTKINLTEGKIDQVQERIGATQDLMSRKRETLGRLIFFLNQRDQEDIVASIMKYENISDIAQQIHDVARVQQQVFVIIQELKKAKTALEGDRTELEDKKDELEDLSAEAEARRVQLANVKSEKDRVLKVTKGQENAYQTQIAEIEKQKAAFFKELKELELKAISGGLYIVHIKATKVPAKGTKIFDWPETGYRLTQGYGMTSYAKRGAYGGAPHNGIDIAAGYGSLIRAIGSGQIVANGLSSGWGNWIAIQHDNGLVSLYTHMSSLAPLKVGTVVTKGQIIGYEGNTGKVTGSHLHLSIYKEFFTYLNDKGQLNFNYFEGTLNPRDYL